MTTYKYPDKLVAYLEEVESEENEVFISSGMDSTVFMIPMGIGDDPWVTYIEWCVGSEHFSLVNITGKAFERLKKVMNEAEDLCDE